MFSNRFARELLHPDRVSEDEGRLEKLFVRIVHEIFRSEFPNLSYRDGGGKDGAIDLWSDKNGERHVFECKQIGDRKQSPFESARSEWHKVYGNLERNLPRGLDGGCQPQYGPWFDLHPRISHYSFLVSCSMPLHEKDKLRHKIETDFKTLSAKSTALEHLQHIEVVVVDWDDFRRRLEVQAHVRFRWFRDDFFPGLKNLTHDPVREGFRCYQHETCLPYYSLRKHLERVPNAGINDETVLWRNLAEGSCGLVISGIGGVGKSRLMTEVGKHASQDGWIVCDIGPGATLEGVDGFSRRNSLTGVLYVFDYLENQPAFRDISLHLARLAAEGMRVRFIASARESFDKVEQMFEYDIPIVSHSPETGDQSAWWEGYRESVFEHIAQHLAVDVGDEMQKKVPAVAVLEAALKRNNDVRLGLGAAKRWVDRRVEGLLHDCRVSEKNFAVLAAQFPFGGYAQERLTGPEREAFVALAKAGWIEKRESESGECTYWMIHDYLADQMLIRWIADSRGFQKTAEVKEILRLGYSLGSLGSVIASLQRIIGKTSGFDFGVFSNLLKSEICANESLWKFHRQDILYTKLLSPTAKVALLQQLGDFWRGAEEEVWFQLEIAALAKALAGVSAFKELAPSAQVHFESLIISLAAVADERNMLVNYGLRFLPRNDQLKRIALEWLERFADVLGATYVVRAWLDVGLPWQQIEPYVRTWLCKFGHRIDSQFVLAAWLRVSGTDGLKKFRVEALEWCALHKSEFVAQHVYSAWLDSGGDTSAIASHVQAWLVEHGLQEEAPSHLFRRWLRSGENASPILRHVTTWLDHYKDADCAGYVYPSALDCRELNQTIREPMLNWISSRSSTKEVQPCLVAWLRSKCERSLIAKFVRDWLAANGMTSEAGELIGKWLEADGKQEMVWPYVTVWVELHSDSEFAAPLIQRLLETKGAADEVRSLAQNWLKLKCSTTYAERVLSAWLRGKHGLSVIQGSIIEWCERFPTEMDARYIYEQWLLGGGDPNVLIGCIRAWLTQHDTELDARRVFEALLSVGVPWQSYGVHLANWTKMHSQNRNATFFYCTWLSDSQRKPSMIQNSVGAWLREHGEWSGADFVLNAWLRRADAPTDVIRAGYETWMAAHGHSAQAKEVLKKWELARERERKARLGKSI